MEFTSEVEGIPENYFWDYVYFHGKLMDITGPQANISAPDLVWSKLKKDSVVDGIHPCTVYGVVCTLFIWTAKHSPFASGEDKRTGLIVMNADIESLEYAKTLMEKRVNSL